MATIGEHAQGSSWVTVGTQGASVHTAQTRVLLQIQLLGSGSVSAVNLPVYVEVASGTATLNAVSCGHPDVSTSSVTLGVTPGIVDAWIGKVTAADMTNFSTKPNPPAGDAGQSRRHHRDRPRPCRHGQHHAGQRDVQLFRHSAQTKKTVTTTNFTSVADGQPARRSGA